MFMHSYPRGRAWKCLDNQPSDKPAGLRLAGPCQSASMPLDSNFESQPTRESGFKSLSISGDGLCADGEGCTARSYQLLFVFPLNAGTRRQLLVRAILSILDVLIFSATRCCRVLSNNRARCLDVCVAIAIKLVALSDYHLFLRE